MSSIYAAAQRLTESQKRKFREARSAGASNSDALASAEGRKKVSAPDFGTIAQVLIGASRPGPPVNAPFAAVKKMIGRELTAAEKREFSAEYYARCAKHHEAKAKPKRRAPTKRKA